MYTRFSNQGETVNRSIHREAEPGGAKFSKSSNKGYLIFAWDWHGRCYIECAPAEAGRFKTGEKTHEHPFSEDVG
jgi:hypothetical protein